MGVRRRPIDPDTNCQSQTIRQVAPIALEGAALSRGLLAMPADMGGAISKGLQPMMKLVRLNWLSGCELDGG